MGAKTNPRRARRQGDQPGPDDELPRSLPRAERPCLTSRRDAVQPPLPAPRRRPPAPLSCLHDPSPVLRRVPVRPRRASPQLPDPPARSRGVLERGPGGTSARHHSALARMTISRHRWSTDVISSRAAELPPGSQGPRGASRSSRRRFPRACPFLAQPFIACVAYIDPGDRATNVAPGSKLGSSLVCGAFIAWSLMTMVLQTLFLQARVRDPPRPPRVVPASAFSRRTSIGLWLPGQADRDGRGPGRVSSARRARVPAPALGSRLFPSTIITHVAASGVLGLQRFPVRLLEAASIASIIGVDQHVLRSSS